MRRNVTVIALVSLISIGIALSDDMKDQQQRQPGSSPSENADSQFTSQPQPQPQTSTHVLPLDNFDDRSLLDLFGEVSKDYFTSAFFPPTDVLCDWSWRNGRCEPACACRLRYKFGDFHLGRSCRIRTNRGAGEGNDEREGYRDYDEEEEEEDGDGDEEDETFDDSPPPNCSSPPFNSIYYKTLTAAVNKGNVARAKIQNKLHEVKPRRKVCEALSGKYLKGVGMNIPEFKFCERLIDGGGRRGGEDDWRDEPGGEDGGWGGIDEDAVRGDEHKGGDGFVEEDEDDEGGVGGEEVDDTGSGGAKVIEEEEEENIIMSRNKQHPTAHDEQPPQRPAKEHVQPQWGANDAKLGPS